MDEHQNGNCMYWTNTTVVTVWNGCTPRWWLYVLNEHHSGDYELDGHHDGDSMYLIDTTVVTLCIGWTPWWWLYVLEGHHSGNCMYWMDTTVYRMFWMDTTVYRCIGRTPQCTVCIGSTPQWWLYVLDGHHSGDCMYWAYHSSRCKQLHVPQ